MAQQYITDSIVDAVERSVSDKNARIIDISCGAGDILRALRERGYTNLSGTNHTEYDTAPGGVPITEKVDLLQGVPFPNARYDAVICSEVLEHVCDHVKAVQELTRMLRQGGILFLSTPNILRLRSRCSFFLSGFHKRKRPFVRYDVPLSRYYDSHNFVVEFPVLHYMLTASGMRVEKLYRSKMKFLAVVYLLAFFVPVSVSTACQLFIRDREPRQKKHYRDLWRFMLHPHMLASEVLIVRARKL
jgi:SAM-dependent methyltransferase